MPAYHSSFNVADQNIRIYGNIPLLPIRTSQKGPAPTTNDEMDVIDECIDTYRANAFFKNFEILGNGDRLLIYITLFIQDCIVRLSKSPGMGNTEGSRMMVGLATNSVSVPGEAGFALNAMYEPALRDADALRAYLTQVRVETSIRLAAKVYGGGDKASKWWLMFGKKKFMGIASIINNN